MIVNKWLSTEVIVNVSTEQIETNVILNKTNTQ